MVKVLVIGAAGNIGSAALASCLDRGHTITAFLRTPSKLAPEFQNVPNLRIVKGDASSSEDLLSAMEDQDAIIQAAVRGSFLPWGKSDSEQVIRTIVSAALQTQALRPAAQNPLRVWVMSGQNVLDIPGTNKIEGDVLLLYKEHHANYAYLRATADALDWSLLCPGRIDEGKPAGPLVRTIDHIGLWSPPGFIGKLPFIGTLLNVFYNFSQQHLTYQSVGDFLADNLGPGEDMRGKRVGLLEDPSPKSE